MTEVVHITVLDNFLQDPEAHLEDINSNVFQDFQDGERVFKNIQLRSGDEVESKLLSIIQEFDCSYNFVRKSPKSQEEPNWIHHDKMIGDMIAILYLNKEHPDVAGTSIFKHQGSFIGKEDQPIVEDATPTINIAMQFNRMVVLPAHVYHGRNMVNNFGKDSNSRMVQILFLKKTQ
jgi:hypothetical protein